MRLGINQVKIKFKGGGGEYTYDGDNFTSYPKYHYYPGVVGTSLVMKSKIEGDSWTIAYDFKSGLLSAKGTEIWKRIE